MRTLALLLACAAACGGSAPAEPSLEATAEDARSRSVALPAKFLQVPLVRQKTDYSCGDAVTLAILRYWKNAQYKQVPETALYGPLGTTEENGTEPRQMAAFLDREDGLSARTRTKVTLSDLLAAVDAGQPVIVDFEAWQDVPSLKDLKPWATDWIDGHYAVLAGYDAERLYFMDPSTGGHYAFIPRAEFLDRWHDVVDGVRTQHLAIFVQSRLAPWVPPHAPPPRATPID